MTQKPVTVSGPAASRQGILTIRNNGRRAFPITAEIAFTSSIETRQLVPHFWIDATNETDAVQGLREDFGIAID